ncbi:hypothetical protein [Mycolicibacterium frederiksbergense]|uniref:hypothetical protein n=1 Tax=Mycolicibacterium frederiksbergense TaxID=117567 RepID=UPI00399B3C52
MTTLDPSTRQLTFGEAPVLFLVGLNLYIAALYLNFAVTVGGFVVPGVLGLVGAVCLVNHVRNLMPAALLVAFLTLSLLAGGSGSEMFDIRLPSYVQIVVAIGCAHVLLCSMGRYAVAVRKTLLAWMLFVTVGVIIEALFPAFRELSDAFRTWAFEGRFLYTYDARDLREYGFIRPSLFSQEPSHVAKAFIVFATGWYLLAVRRRLTVLIICTVLVMMFLRSPFVVLSVPLALYLDRIASGRPLTRVFAAGIPLLGVIAVTIAEVFSTRLQGIMSSNDSSFFTRYQGPFTVAREALEQYPVFGVGIGAKEALWEFVRDSYSRNFTDAGYLYGVYLDYFNNALATTLMFFGLVGAAIFYYLIAYWAKSFGIRAIISIPVVILFFMLDGAFEGIRMWSSIALVMGCYLIAKQAHDEQRQRPERASELPSGSSSSPFPVARPAALPNRTLASGPPVGRHL